MKTAFSVLSLIALLAACVWGFMNFPTMTLYILGGAVFFGLAVFTLFAIVQAFGVPVRLSPKAVLLVASNCTSLAIAAQTFPDAAVMVVMTTLYVGGAAGILYFAEWLVRRNRNEPLPPKKNIDEASFDWIKRQGSSKRLLFVCQTKPHPREEWVDWEVLETKEQWDRAKDQLTRWPDESRVVKREYGVDTVFNPWLEDWFGYYQR